MIKDCKYRPLFLKGKIGQGSYSLVSVCKNEESLDKKHKAKVILKNKTFIKGYDAYVFQSENVQEKIMNYLKLNNIPYICGIDEIDTLVDKDVIEMDTDRSTIKVLYRANSTDNVLMLTNKCNNNCIMCPDSLKVRTENKNISLSILKKYIELIDKEVKFLCITGGEPTLLKKDFIEIVRYLGEKLPETEYLLLTNGRMFYNKNFVEAFLKSTPKNLITAIPIHGHYPELHDSISGVKGSFIQSFYGLKNLYELGGKIEIRVVINKLNYNVITNIAAMISNYFPKVVRVNFMAMEMLGNAVVNKEKVWIDFNSVQEKLKEAAFILLKGGIEVGIYNFPLCSLDESVWNLSVRSISDYKIRYKEQCKECSVMKNCGGFFNSTINMKDLKVKPIQ
ncbi:His-Xaa-Ser system radical SAM maturase HxsC [Clostridium ljungdahlii]|uniref:Antilisterial bacteriocin subtilosin biosynthesis protein AlbA n=1 Tax=Clostridium ljungdahlii TaxID=1538 RepID=A0A166RT07_9CLOT|nr:His-Xaa-Ser system radical SAM maturase HxsC [Clostridium ljungdahlii]OAA91087.1 Antilisterial bacteriocin subtilosin biosynthesis protein AlbA [Clostridium ljungdahlii]